MREIKFRGLNTKGEWVYGSLVTTTHGILKVPNARTKTWIIESAFGNGGWFNVVLKQYVKPKTVGQFTGETSDVGIDIYEGDIIKKTAMIIGDDDITGVVEFSEGQYWIVDPGENCQPLFSETAQIEVRGNIHQSPDLLDKARGES